MCISQEKLDKTIVAIRQERSRNKFKAVRAGSKGVHGGEQPDKLYWLWLFYFL